MIKMKDFYEYYMNKVRIDSFTMLNERQDGGFITPACGFELLLSRKWKRSVLLLDCND